VKRSGRGGARIEDDVRHNVIELLLRVDPHPQRIAELVERLRSDTLAVPRRFKHCTKLASPEARRARLLDGECLVAFAQTTRHARGSSHPHCAVPYE